MIRFSLPLVTRTLLAASLALAAVAQAQAQQSPPPRAAAGLRAGLQHDLDVYMKERSKEEHLSALSLSVSLGKGQPTTSVTSGTTKYGSGPRVTPSDLFQIGSNTKAFTAVAILQLEAAGRLSIDAPLGTYLPQYPAYRKLTLRHLLDMTSGLESYDNTPAWDRQYSQSPNANMSADALIRMIYPKILYPQGTKYHYSNTGYLLAQEVVAARSSSKSFATEIDRIIASVGLKDTFYTSNLYPPAVASRVVAGYYGNNDPSFGKFIGKDMTGHSLSWAQGAGSIVSTPADLVTWARALYEGTTLLPAKQRQELKSMISLKTAKPLAVPTAEDPAGFALGVAQRYDAGFGAFWFYQGETLGFRAVHLYFPKSGLVIAVFANSRPIESKSKLQSLFKTVYDTIQAAGK